MALSTNFCKFSLNKTGKDIIELFAEAANSRKIELEL